MAAFYNENAMSIESKPGNCENLVQFPLLTKDTGVIPWHLLQNNVRCFSLFCTPLKTLHCFIGSTMHINTSKCTAIQGLRK